MIATDASFVGFNAAFGIDDRKVADDIMGEKLHAADYTVFEERNQSAAPTNV